MKIGLITGHDAIKQGASHNGITEFDFNDQLLVGMYKSLPPNHNVVHFFRSADIKGYTNQMIDLHERLKKFGCDLAIELHLNDFHNPDVDGHEVLVVSEQARVYAEQLNDKFTKYLTNNDRGVKKISSSDNGYGFLHRGSYPCLIVEPFFIQHIDDYLHGEEKRSNLILAYTEFLNEIVD